MLSTLFFIKVYASEVFIRVNVYSAYFRVIQDFFNVCNVVPIVYIGVCFFTFSVFTFNVWAWPVFYYCPVPIFTITTTHHATSNVWLSPVAIAPWSSITVTKLTAKQVYSTESTVTVSRSSVFVALASVSHIS